MKKINLKGISEILSEKELKNVVGGGSSVNPCCGSACTTSNDCSHGKICVSVSGEKYCY